MTRRGRRHDDPGRPGDPAPPRLRRRRALDEVGRGDASTCRGVDGARRAAAEPADDGASRAAGATGTTTVEVNGKRFDVEHVGARVGRSRPPPAPAAAKARKPRRAAGGGGGGAAGSGDVDRADAGHDRQGARRGRPGGRGRPGRRRARGDEDGEPDRRREGRHGQGDQGRRPATPSAAATSSPSSTERPSALARRLVSGRTDRRHAIESRTGYSAASARASLRAGWTSRLSTMSVTLRLAVTARAITEISSAAWRPTIEPPSTTPVAGSEMILTKPRGSLLISALAAGRERHLGDPDLAARTRTPRPRPARRRRSRAR